MFELLRRHSIFHEERPGAYGTVSIRQSNEQTSKIKPLLRPDRVGRKQAVERSSVLSLLLRCFQSRQTLKPAVPFSALTTAACYRGDLYSFVCDVGIHCESWFIRRTAETGKIHIAHRGRS
jgi:hypothetical protein